MKNEEKKVSRGRKFIAGLALVLSMSGLSSCGVKNNNTNNEVTDTIIENSQEIGDTNVFAPDETIEVETPVEVVEDENKDNKEVKEDTSVEENKEETEEVSEKDIKEDNITIDTKSNEEVLYDDFVLPDIGEYDGYSIVEALILAGYPADVEYRAKIAEHLGIEFTRTAEDNLEMLRLLKEYHTWLVQNSSVNNENNATSEKTESEENKQIETNEDFQESNTQGQNNDNISQEDVDDKRDEEDKDEECQHSKSHIIKRVTNMGVEGHNISSYDVCDDCGQEKFVGTERFNHTFVAQSPVKENINGCHYDSVVYETSYCHDCNKTYRKELSRTNMIEHNYVEKEEVKSISDTEHTRTKYNECSRCGDIVDKIVTNENHDLKTEEKQENVTEYGYDLVKYSYCTKCNFKKEISRNHVVLKDCEHTKYHQVVEIENETESSHDLVTYKVCDDCLLKEFVSRVHVVHVFTKEQKPRIENVNGCTFDEVYYEVYTCGSNTYERPIESTRVTKTQHTFGEEKTRIEKDDKDNHFLVTYHVCIKDGVEEIISTQKLEHVFEETSKTINPSDNQSGYHIITITYICSECGEEKIESKTVACTSNGVIKYVQDNGEWYQYEECSICGRELNKLPHTHNYDGATWVYYDDNTGAYRNCDICGERQDHTHSYGSNGDLDNCDECGYPKEQVHSHSYGDWKKDENSGNDTICYTRHRECSCGASETDSVYHLFSKWEVHSFSSILKKGQKKSKCDNIGCDYIKYEEIFEDEYKAMTNSSNSVTNSSISGQSLSGSFDQESAVNETLTEEVVMGEQEISTNGEATNIEENAIQKTDSITDVVNEEETSMEENTTTADLGSEEETPIEETPNIPETQETSEITEETPATDESNSNSESEATEEDYEMYVEFIESETDIESVNVYIEETSESNEQETTNTQEEAKTLTLTPEN